MPNSRLVSVSLFLRLLNAKEVFEFVVKILPKTFQKNCAEKLKVALGVRPLHVEYDGPGKALGQSP